MLLGLVMGIELDLFMAQSGFMDRWNRHRNDPGCVVGEHRHCPAPPLIFSLPSPLFGDIEMLFMLEEWGLNFEEGEKERRERELFIYMHTLRSYIRVRVYYICHSIY
uniref:Uncharacterized protein n=1 Tax=Opuntia streptacantha TaxID=393608 RepID=A0A7C8YUV3_OPUST